ncbi:MAG: LytTR family DNA-binding domain-containing protein [Bacteroidota bacterium]
MNVLIVEDESYTASLLQEIIEQDADFFVTQKLESVVEAVEYLSKYQKNLDLLFFDIQLADGRSFEIFKHIDVVVPVIFCTAYDEFSLQAIKNNGIDYILKPFKESEIHSALQKYKKLLSNLQPKQPVAIDFQPNPKKTYQQSFLAQYREKTIIKNIEEVALFYVEAETVYLYTFKGEKFALFKKMEYLESACDPAQFYRINRQMLVNRTAILSFEPYFNRKIILQLKIKCADQVIVSRLKVSPFKKWLEG